MRGVRSKPINCEIHNLIVGFDRCYEKVSVGKYCDKHKVDANRFYKRKSWNKIGRDTRKQLFSENSDKKKQALLTTREWCKKNKKICKEEGCNKEVWYSSNFCKKHSCSNILRGFCKKKQPKI